MSEAGSSVSVESPTSGEVAVVKKEAAAHGPPAKSEISGAVFNLANAVSTHFIFCGVLGVRLLTPPLHLSFSLHP